MRKTLFKLGSILLALTLLMVPMSAFAVKAADDIIPEEEVSPTDEMLRSERYLRSFLSEENDSRQAMLFGEFIASRLKYATARSLSRTDGGKWMGSVDIFEAFSAGEPAGFFLQQGTVQYGYQKLPAGTESCELKVGSVSETIAYDGQPLFSFPEMELGEDALEGEVALSVMYYNSQYDIPLVEHYPGAALDRSEAMLAMAPAYAAYLSEKEALGDELVDHAVMKLRSYVRDSRTQERSYIWELYVVHGDELPAPATLIRYDTFQGTTKVLKRTLRSYF